MSRLSQTVIAGNRLRSWVTCTMPQAAAGPWWSSRLISWPSKVTVPRLGRSRPLTVLSTVDLPAPFGPMRQVIVPALDVEVDALEDVAGAVAGDDALELQDGRHR